MIKYLYKLNTKSNYDALDNAEHIYLPGVSYLTETGEVIFDNWGIKNQCLRQEIQQLSGITELSKRRVRALTNEIFTRTIMTEQSKKPFIYDGMYMENGQMYEGKSGEVSGLSYTGNEWVQNNSSIFNEDELNVPVLQFVFNAFDNFGFLDSQEMAEANVVLNPNNTTPVTDAATIAEIDAEIYNAVNDMEPIGATLEEIYNCDLVKAFNFETNEINFAGAFNYYMLSDLTSDWDISDFDRIKTRYAMDSQENIYIQVSAFGARWNSSTNMYTFQCPDCMEMKKLTGLSNFEDCVYDMDGTPVFGDTITLETVANPFANSQTMEKLAIPEQINYMAAGTLENTPELEEVHLLGINDYGNVAFGWGGHDSLTQVHFYQPTGLIAGGNYVFGDATEWADNPINGAVIGDLMSGTYDPTDGQSQGIDDSGTRSTKGGAENNTNTVAEITSQSLEEQILNAIGGIKFIFHYKLQTIGELSNNPGTGLPGPGIPVTPDRGASTDYISDVPMDFIIYQFLCSSNTPYSFYGLLSGGNEGGTISTGGGGLKGGSKGANDPEYLLGNILFILQDSDAKKLSAALSDEDSQLYCPALAQRILPYSILKNQASNFDNGGGIHTEPLVPGNDAVV